MIRRIITRLSVIIFELSSLKCQFCENTHTIVFIANVCQKTNKFLNEAMEELNRIALSNLGQYLQIPSVHPNVDYDSCVEFLERLGKDLDLPVEVIFVKPRKPVVIVTWKGQRPELKSVLLNSHMDVVPVFEEKWKYKPFSAEIVDGKIYARGSQDMKSIGIQYLEAIRRLKLEGRTFKRTIYISFVPDEEKGGEDGMGLFVQTEFFKRMNVGTSLDEGAPNNENEFRVFYGEKYCWQFTVHCKGPTGHGSLLLEETAGEKVTYLLNKAYNYRNQQKLKTNGDPNILGNVASINCTQIRGGVQDNVIPQELSITFDCRIPSIYCMKEFEEMLHQWCEEAGSNCDIEFHQKNKPILDTPIDESNIFWNAFKSAGEKLRIQLNTKICEVGISAFGFSPINNTPLLVHCHNEYLGVDTYLKGIEIYGVHISELANAE